MTKSAKQGTAKAPAETAETVPAATVPTATSGDAEPEATAEPGEAAASSPGEADPGEAAKPDLEETKRKFRLALERKHQVHNEGQGKTGRDGGKINSAHGPAASRRNFRRKSG